MTSWLSSMVPSLVCFWWRRSSMGGQSTPPISLEINPSRADSLVSPGCVFGVVCGRQACLFRHFITVKSTACLPTAPRAHRRQCQIQALAANDKSGLPVQNDSRLGLQHRRQSSWPLPRWPASLLPPQRPAGIMHAVSPPFLVPKGTRNQSKPGLTIDVCSFPGPHAIRELRLGRHE